MTCLDAGGPKEGMTLSVPETTSDVAGWLVAGISTMSMRSRNDSGGDLILKTWQEDEKNF